MIIISSLAILLLQLLPPAADALSLHPSAFPAYRAPRQSPSFQKLLAQKSYNNNRIHDTSLHRLSSSATAISEARSSSAFLNNEEQTTIDLTESLQNEEVFLDHDNNSSSKTETHFWKWRNHDIFCEVRSPAADISSSRSKPTVILLHGFGASTTYWRQTMETLQNEGFEVHALDLLGQGRSSKPYYRTKDDGGLAKKFPYKLYPKDSAVNIAAEEETSPIAMGANTNSKVKYSINLWAKMIDDYARHCEMDEVILMGNSLGSLVALSAATGDFIETPNNIDRENFFGYLAGNHLGENSRVKGVCLFNCAVGLNSMNVLKNPSFSAVQRSVLKWVFEVLNKLIFDNEALLKFALNNIVTKDLLRDALKSLYTYNPEQVDDELVDSFYYPAKFGGDGAIEAIRQIYCNDAGLTPMEITAKYPEIMNKLPLHLIWGDADVVTPIEGDVGHFYCDRVANNRGGNGKTTIDVVSGGHLLFDDNPSDTHNSLLRWINKIVM